MTIKKYNKVISELNVLIYTCCDILDLKKPYIYYLKYDHTNFEMYDASSELISTDNRDAPNKNIDRIIFVKKENSFYININRLDDVIESRVLIIRQIRENFQYKQVYLFLNNKDTNVSQFRIGQWRYCLESRKQNNGFVITSPTELDKSAFASFIMSVIYKIGVNYDFKTNLKSGFNTYNDILIEIESIYNINTIRSAYTKFKKNAQ